MNFDELKKEAERLGYELVKKTDEIFLLSDEEYVKYKRNIPHINELWWLRSPAADSNNSARVDRLGCVSNYGTKVNYNNYGVRPALRTPYLPIGERIIKYDFPWIAIDDNLAIAEVPIAFRRFDEKSNDYETSEVRQFLQDWVAERSENDDYN